MSEFIGQIVSSSENFVKINVPDDVSQRFDKVKEEAQEFINSRAFQNVIEISYLIRDVSTFMYEKFIRKNAERLQQQVQQFVEDNRPVLQEVCLFLVTWPGPWLFLLQCYISTSLLRFSKYLSKRLEKPETAVVNRALAILANFWNKFANIYHGHQVIGMEKIPHNTAAILVWYHGPVPIDYISLVSKLYLRDGRMVNSVVDKFLTGLPYWSDIETHFKLTTGGKGYCVDLLENGEIMGVAVGGAREALFDFDYNTEWSCRTGFAKVALLTGAPIIPIFTENIRETYCTMEAGKNIWRFLYEKTKLPLVPVYGGFPVRLTTHVGNPLRAKPDETADQFAQRVQKTMQEMISMHQPEGKGISELVLDRIYQQYNIEDKMV